MKVVINAKHGGFSLSHKACMRYAELSGFKLCPFTEARDAFGGINFKKFVPWDGKGELFYAHYSTKPLKKDGTYKEDSYWSDRDLPRDDPVLVQVVEELGKEANGTCAALKIVEIPDDVEWEIEEYDGNEWVSERHRTWS